MSLAACNDLWWWAHGRQARANGPWPWASSGVELPLRGLAWIWAMREVLGAEVKMKKEVKKRTIHTRVNKQRQNLLETLTETQHGAENTNALVKNLIRNMGQYKTKAMLQILSDASQQLRFVRLRCTAHGSLHAFTKAGAGTPHLLFLINSVYLHRARCDNF